MFDELPRPLLFGHRGASAHAPENTLAAFELASRTGAHVLELDVHLTRDGQVVVIHDETVDRTTDGSGLVRDLDLGKLQGLDAGARFRPGAGYPFRNKGAHIPTLAEVLAAFPRAAFNIEVKPRAPGVVAAVLRVLDKTPRSQVLLTAADDVVIQEMETSARGFALGMSRGQALAVWRGAWRGRVPEGFRGRALQIPWRRGLLPIATRGVIAAAKRAGMEVHVWTLNAPHTVVAALRRGADGVMSDDPGMMAGIVDDFASGALR